MGRILERGAVDVSDEPDGDPQVSNPPQRAIGHLRTKVRAANADIDDIADALAGMAGPGAGAHFIGESGHPVENGVDIGNDVLAVHQYLLVARRSQRDMSYG